MQFNEIKQIAKDEWKQIQESKILNVFIGTATCGRSAGALEVKKRFKKKLKLKNIKANIIDVGCLGPCWAEPLISIMKPGRSNIFYKNVTIEKVDELVNEYIIKDNPMPDYALGLVGDVEESKIPLLWNIPYFKSQKRLLFRNFGFINPTQINHYIANKGYSGLYKTLSMKPVVIIDKIKKSGLRGRGGGGFPTGRKWEAAFQSVEKEKYVVCNADEGDPGAFMDRSVLEGEPYAVLEGMTIAGFTVGAKKRFYICEGRVSFSYKAFTKSYSRSD